MKDHHKDNLGWAQKNGYEFHAESKGPIFQDARNLDIFRGAYSFCNHVCGIYRNTPFEIIDVRKETQREDASFVDKTIILIPTAGLDLPNFDLLPRRESVGMNFLGINYNHNHHRSYQVILIHKPTYSYLWRIGIHFPASQKFKCRH